MSAASIPPVVLPKHRNTGIVVAVGCVLLALLILFIFTFEMADPAPREIPMKTSTSLTDLEIKDLKIETGGAGGGTPSNDPIHEVTPQTEKILTQRKNGQIFTKVIGESEQPFFYEASAKFLELLSPTTNISSLKWRADCLNHYISTKILKGVS